MAVKQFGLDMNSLVELDARIKTKEINDLLDLPVTIVVNEFDDDAVESFTKGMIRAHRSGQPIVPVIIDSYGGYVYSLLSMISQIQSSQIPVATICRGKAMSCGSILLSCGEEGHRYMDPNAHVMIHDVSSMKWGKNEELKASAKQTDKLHKQVFHLLAKNCGHSKDYFLDMIHEKSHAEWYLGATESKKHNIINHIHIPQFNVSVAVDIEFG